MAADAVDLVVAMLATAAVRRDTVHSTAPQSLVEEVVVLLAVDVEDAVAHLVLAIAAARRDTDPLTAQQSLAEEVEASEGIKSQKEYCK